MTEIQYILLCVSLAYLITRHQSFRWFREGVSRIYKAHRNSGSRWTRIWEAIEFLFHCEYCMGFWFGLAFYDLFFTYSGIFEVICNGLITAIASVVVIGMAAKR